ncbi:Phosphoethanolamine N-methyltransferase [Penicillium daleae]|uniref:Phosphoethanolamine N-methyltransferase n=1 Tax=Penicillium daleae TaxID=63821 RepID=A0AAD6CHK7_9EURO|nr:Phosphoethanolamine N-methyltransferase [Penicillium daleae]KAJ5464376.1 Phosphoethanolamine N-methyltransferase [Penicillium daleae]
MTELDRPTDSTGIEVDADASSPSDVDSIRSDLTSLSESIYSYVYENGRTYHAYGSGTYVCDLEL